LRAFALAAGSIVGHDRRYPNNLFDRTHRRHFTAGVEILR